MNNLYVAVIAYISDSRIRKLTVLLLKFGMKIIILLELHQILEVNILHTCILFPYNIAYTYDDLC